jgi:outer membrane receptor protein involved in Fe transport
MPRSLGLAYALLAVSAVQAPAQLTRGSISGTVFDPGGAPARGVVVAATPQGAEFRYTTLTNESGIYRLAGLEPGAYNIEFLKNGFQAARKGAIFVDSTEDALLNHTLALAPVSDSISVEAAPAGVELSKTSASIDRTLTPVVMEKVPLIGALERDVMSLVALGPASVRARGIEFSYVAAGQRAGRIEFLADGLDNRQQGFDFARWRPIPEQISEFQVKTNAYSAEFGRTSGVVVSVISRSGGNRFHGSVWDYYNASWMAATTLANKRANLGKPRFQEHDAGMSFGGPLRRDRTFIFGLFQGKPMTAGPSVALAPAVTIPTPAGYAELPRLPLGPDQSPESRQAVLGALGFLAEVYPLISRFERVRTVYINKTPLAVGEARVPTPNRANVIMTLVRLDHRVTDRDNFTLRWQMEHFQEDLARSGRAALSNAAFGALFSSRFARREVGSILGSHTHALGTSAVNEFRFGADIVPMADAKPAQREGPYVATQGFAFGANPVAPWQQDLLTLQAQDVVTVQRGRHALKAGADFLKTRGKNTNANFSRGFWFFPTLEDLLNNRPAELRYQRQASTSTPTQLQQAYFFQDNFRLTPNLTLNFGLRYQTAGTPLAVFGARTPALLDAGIPKPVRRDTNDWAPRFGFAWSPTPRTVLRGGFGVAYEQSLTPYGFNVFFVTYPESIRISLFAPGIYNRFPEIPAGGPGVPPLLPANYDFKSPSRRAVNPTTHFYSFSVQRELTRSNMVEVGYLGNRAYHLWRTNETNPAILTSEQAALVRSTGDATAIPAQARRVNPAWASRQVAETDGFSNYNAGYIRYERRAGKRVQVGAAYTWSAALDDGLGLPQDPSNFRREYARATIDRPHRLSAHWVWMGPLLSRSRAIVKHAAGGWQIAGYAECQSGEPFTVSTGVDSNGDLATNVDSHNDRPDFNPGGALSLDPATGNWRSFRAPLDAAGRFVTPRSPQGLPLQNSMPGGGNLGRNTFRGPAFANVNVSLLKEFTARDRVRIELRASSVNSLNHRNFGPPVATMSNPQFGTNQSNPDARMILLGLKLHF